MTHIYINGRLQFGDEVPVWPDMEFIIYAQDPAWLFIGGRPKTIEEAQKKLLLASGSSAANSARDIPLHRLKIDQRKLREFRDTMMFGSGVYLPRDKFRKARVNVCTIQVEDLVKRLVETINSPQPWGRLARQLILSHSQQAQTGDSQSTSTQATPRTILESYARWLQADLVDLYFDWLQMGYTCGEIWDHIRDDLEDLPTWDPESFNMKPAMEPTLDILTRDREYPMFLEVAYVNLAQAFVPSDDHAIGPDTCLIALGKYHRAAAAMLDAPGPLSLSNLYTNWPEEDWKPRWDEMKSKPANELQDIFMDSFFSSLERKIAAPGMAEFVQGTVGHVIQPYLNHLMKACQEQSLNLEELMQDESLAELMKMMR